MSDKLTIQRQGRGRHSLTITRRLDRYDVTTNGGDNITSYEVDQIAAFIGDDPDGASLVEKLRARVG